MCTKYLNICLHVNTSKPQKLTVLNWLVGAFHSKPVTLYIWFDIVRENTKLLSTFSNLIVQRKTNTRSPSKPVKLLWSDKTLRLICSRKFPKGLLVFVHLYKLEIGWDKELALSSRNAWEVKQECTAGVYISTSLCVFGWFFLGRKLKNLRSPRTFHIHYNMAENFHDRWTLRHPLSFVTSGCSGNPQKNIRGIEAV